MANLIKRWYNGRKVKKLNREVVRLGTLPSLFHYHMTDTDEYIYYAVTLYASASGIRRFKVHHQQGAPNYKGHQYYGRILLPWIHGADMFKYNIKEYFLDENDNIQSKKKHYSRNKAEETSPKKTAGKVIDINDHR